MSLRPILFAAGAITIALGATLALSRWGGGGKSDLSSFAQVVQQGQELESQAEARRRRHAAKRALAAEVVAGRMSLREAAGHFRRLDEAAPAFPRPAADERALCDGVLDCAWEVLAQEGRFAEAARWHAEIFTTHPDLLTGPPIGHRYYAAWAAALAGCGQSRDSSGLDEKSRAGLRRQALGWLRDELEAYRRLLEAHPERTCGWVAGSLTRWLWDPYFAAVRAPDALARLPEEERRAWQQFWEEVEALRKRADKP
jgi:hypothetical protein